MEKSESDISILLVICPPVCIFIIFLFINLTLLQDPSVKAETMNSTECVLMKFYDHVDHHWDFFF